MNKQLIILIILIISVFSNDKAPSKEFLDNLKCAEEGNNQKFAQGDKALICVHFVYGTQGNYNAQKITYEVKVDHYITLTATGATEMIKNEFSGKSVYMVVQASTSEVRTPAAKYQVDDRLYPQFNVVVTLDNGKVKKDTVQWDNGNFSDLDYDSDEENNYVDVKNCGGTAKCDPQVYVSWLGQDKSGTYMTSAGLRNSRFHKYSGKELWKNSQEFFN